MMVTAARLRISARHPYDALNVNVSLNTVTRKGRNPSLLMLVGGIFAIILLLTKLVSNVKMARFNGKIPRNAVL
jgi:hypothetical protein